MTGMQTIITKEPSAITEKHPIASDAENVNESVRSIFRFEICCKPSQKNSKNNIQKGRISVFFQVNFYLKLHLKTIKQYWRCKKMAKGSENEYFKLSKDEFQNYRIIYVIIRRKQVF